MFDLMIILFIAILAITLFIVIKSSESLIDNSSLLGIKLGMSEYLVGILIVALGTSFPELITSLIALFSIEKYSEFILGDIIGSNIANTLLVFGVLLALSKNQMRIKKNLLDIIVLSLVSAIVGISMIFGVMNRFIGIILLIVYSIYVYLDFKKDIHSKKLKTIVKEKISLLSFKILLAMIFLFIGARGVVYSVENLALIMNIPIAIISLTTVALGTSLPELVVTIVAAKKKQFQLAYGNIIGSNIANIGLILGVSSVLKNLIFSFEIFNFSTIVLLFTCVYLIVVSLKKNIRPYMGYLLLAFYIYYILTLFLC